MPGLKFVGGEGQFVAGIPARDLTADEAAAYPAAAESPLYEPEGGGRRRRTATDDETTGESGDE